MLTSFFQFILPKKP